MFINNLDDIMEQTNSKIKQIDDDIKKLDITKISLEKTIKNLKIQKRILFILSIIIDIILFTLFIKNFSFISFMFILSLVVFHNFILFIMILNIDKEQKDLNNQRTKIYMETMKLLMEQMDLTDNVNNLIKTNLTILYDELDQLENEVINT